MNHDPELRKAEIKSIKAEKKYKGSSIGSIDRWLEHAADKLASARHEVDISKELDPKRKATLRASMADAFQTVHEIRKAVCESKKTTLG